MSKKKYVSRRDFIASVTAAGIASQLAAFPSHLNAQKEASDKLSTICVFSKHLQFLPDYAAMAQTAAKIGFDGVDLTVRPGGHVLPENVTKDLPLAVSEIKKAGLKIPMMATGITDPDHPNTEKILDTASSLGIRYYRLGYLKYNDNLSIIDSLDVYKRKFWKLQTLNEKYQMHGAYQNHSGNRVGGPVWDIAYLLNDMDPKWLGCQYDVRHATAEGGRSWELGMKLLGPYIKTTAIKDFYWLKEDDEWHENNCPLGKGMVNFNKYFKLYKKLSISGPISMHFEYKLHEKSESIDTIKSKVIEALDSDLKVLRKMLKTIG